MRDRICSIISVLVLLFVAGCATGEFVAGGDDGATPAFGVDSGGAPDASVPPAPDARPPLPGTPDAALPLPPPDAALPPDATPVTLPIDAALPPPPPDANNCPVSNLLSNSNFDQGAGGGWVETSGYTPPFPLVTHAAQMSLPPHSPDYAVWLGGYLEDMDAGIPAIDVISQDFAVPVGATGLQIAGMRFIGTEEFAGEFDRLTVSIRTPAGSLLENLVDPTVPCFAGSCTWANEDETGSYVPFTLTPIGNYAGQTIRIQFESDVDTTLNTNFFLDSVAARVMICQ